MRIAILIFCLIIAGCAEDTSSVVENDNEDTMPKEYICDMEQSSEEDEHVFFLCNQHSFFNGSTKSDEFALSGKSSSKTSADTPHGAGYELGDLSEGTFIVVEVWVLDSLKSGRIIISDVDGELYEVQQKYSEQRDGNWTKMIAFKELTKNVSNVRVYVSSADTIPCYFDDLSIKIYSKRPYLKKGLPVLRVTLSQDQLEKLQRGVIAGRETGIISKKFKDYVSGVLTFEGRAMNAEIRLKGDWADHVQSSKWSFRIKLADGYFLNGMQTFSIQSPHTRNFLKEWLFHRVLREEGIIATKYEFVQVIINGKNKGLYAIEQHFDKYLTERMCFREGPIMKFNEDGTWELRKKLFKQDTSLWAPVFLASDIVPFEEKRHRKDSTLFRQLQDGQSVLLALKNEAITPSEYNLKKLAAYYALCDVFGVRHSLIWHNQRWYLNPVTAQIEPAVFDCYYDYGTIQTDSTLFINDPFIDQGQRVSFNHQFFAHSEFRDHYFKFLRLYTDASFIRNVQSKYTEELEEFNILISKEFPFYNFDWTYLNKKASEIKPLVNEIHQVPYKFKGSRLPFDDVCGAGIYLKHSGVKCFVHNGKMTILNYLSCPIKLVGTSMRKDDPLKPLVPNVTLPEFGLRQPSEITIPVGAGIDHIVFDIPSLGLSSERIKALKWPKPSTNSSRKLLAQIGVELRGSADTVFIGPGIVKFTSPHYVPAGKVLKINDNTELLLNNKASLISESPIYACGKNITVTSTDGTGQGIHILNASDSSNLTGVTVEKIGTLNLYNWQLTGAFTFYESPVTIRNCTIQNTTCEDGLNIIRSYFDISDLTVSNTFSDGFDADFCTGVIRNSHFLRTGNDGLDISGSDILVESCTFESNGDKGFSVGEQSTAEVEGCFFKKCVTGLASKDGSNLKVTNTTVTECLTGVWAYQKKPEFAGATIILEHVEFTLNGANAKRDKNSKIKGAKSSVALSPV